MIATDVVRFAGVFSLGIGMSLLLCAYMLPNRRGVVSLSMVLAGVVLIIGGIVPDQYGKPLTQVYIARYLHSH